MYKDLALLLCWSECDQSLVSGPLHVPLHIAEGLVGMAAGLHGFVSSERSDLLLGLALDRVACSLGVGLAVGQALGRLSLGPLGGTTGGEVGVANGGSDGLLGGSHVLVGSVGKSLGHVGKSGCEVVVCCVW